VTPCSKCVCNFCNFRPVNLWEHFNKNRARLAHILQAIFYWYHTDSKRIISSFLTMLETLPFSKAASENIRDINFVIDLERITLAITPRLEGNGGSYEIPYLILLAYVQDTKFNDPISSETFEALKRLVSEQASEFQSISNPNWDDFLRKTQVVTNLKLWRGDRNQLKISSETVKLPSILKSALDEDVEIIKSKTIQFDKMDTDSTSGAYDRFYVGMVRPT